MAVYAASTSLVKPSRAEAVHQLAYHEAPLLAMFMNPTPAGTTKDPVVKDVTHKWNEIKLKNTRDNLYAAIDNSATTMYTTNQYVNYIANRTYLIVEDEVMLVTAASWGSSKWTLTVTRGALSSTAAAHKIDTPAKLMNYYAEGADSTDYESDLGTENSNYTQIFRSDVFTSGTSEAIETYGGENKINQQVAWKIPNLFQQLENALMCPKAYKSGNARIMGGMPSYVPSSMKFDGQGARFDLHRFDDDVQLLVEQGVDRNDLILVCGGQVRKSLSDKKALIVQETMNIRKFDYTLDSITTSNGYKVPIAPTTPAVPSNAYYLFPKGSLQIKFLRALEKEVLGKTGDNQKIMVLMEATAEFHCWQQKGVLYRYNQN